MVYRYLFYLDVSHKAFIKFYSLIVRVVYNYEYVNFNTIYLLQNKTIILTTLREKEKEKGYQTK